MPGKSFLPESIIPDESGEGKSKSLMREWFIARRETYPDRQGKPWGTGPTNPFISDKEAAEILSAERNRIQEMMAVPEQLTLVEEVVKLRDECDKRIAFRARDLRPEDVPVKEAYEWMYESLVKLVGDH